MNFPFNFLTSSESSTALIKNVYGCRGKVFLQEVLKVYRSKYIKASRMLGDQLALAWVVKSHPSFDAKRFTRPQAFLEEIGSASVLFLPCAIYNWTPPEGAGQFHGMTLDVKVHYSYRI